MISVRIRERMVTGSHRSFVRREPPDAFAASMLENMIGLLFRPRATNTRAIGIRIRRRSIQIDSG
jgi:hypothetical protein